jgi:ribonucleoside-diphosphate reductase alpha chain
MTTFNKSNVNPMFKNKFSSDIFELKYKHEGCETWEQLARVLVEDVCGNLRKGEETTNAQRRT